MKVLVVGSGGREHALAWKLAQSPVVEELAGVPIVLVSVGPERTQTIERAFRPMRRRQGIPA